MGGFFGTIATKSCVNDLFYGTDYNSHLGTRRAGLVMFDKEKGFSRKIHNLERDYFRSKFEDELDSFSGNQGIGVISDTDPQPILVNSHLGRFAVVTVAKINNMEDIAQELLERRMHFSEYSANTINQTELVALLINMGRTFVEGINLVYKKIEGSCSMLIMTEKGLIAARDFLGRTPIVIGQKEGAYAVSSETTSFPTVRSSGSITDSPPRTITASTWRLCARRTVRRWVNRTIRRWTASAVCPTRVSVWHWAMLKANGCPTSVRC